MNNKGSAIGLGFLLTLAIGAIVSLVLLQSIAQQTDASLNQRLSINRTYTPAAAGSTIDLIGQELIDTPLVTNTSNGVIITAGNYTIAEGVSTVDGLKRIRYTTSTGGVTKPVNVSYTFGPDGYIEDGGSRSIYTLVIVLSALSICVVLLVPSIREIIGDII